MDEERTRTYDVATPPEPMCHHASRARGGGDEEAAFPAKKEGKDVVHTSPPFSIVAWLRLKKPLRAPPPAAAAAASINTRHQGQL